MVGEFTTERTGAIATRRCSVAFSTNTLSEDLIDNSARWVRGRVRRGRKARTTWMAHRHFIARLALEGNRLQGLSRKKRSTAIYDHLDEAEASALLIEKRVGKNIGRMAPAGPWRDLLEED